MQTRVFLKCAVSGCIHFISHDKNYEGAFREYNELPYLWKTYEHELNHAVILGFDSQCPQRGFRSCDKTTDVRLAPLAVSKWIRPKILVSQLVRTFCGAHPSPIFPVILFSGWFVFAVCLAVDFKSAWGMHPNPGIQSSSQILLSIILKKIEML